VQAAREMAESGTFTYADGLLTFGEINAMFPR
jgi:hypothetical protein